MLKRIVLISLSLIWLLFISSFGSPGWEIAWEVTHDAELGSAARNYRNKIPVDSSSYDGTKVRITVKAGPSGNATLDGSSIGLMTTDDDMDDAANGTFKRITWESDNNGVTCTANQSKVSDELTFDFDKTKRYGIHIYMVDRVNWGFKTVADGLYHNTPGVDDTLTQTVAYAHVNSSGPITKLEVFVAGNGEEENAIFFGINFLLISLLFVSFRKR